VAVSGAAALFTIAFSDWQPSVLVRMSDSDAMAEVARSYDPAFVLVPAEAHFDGVYFYTIALDPLGLSDEHTRIDLYEYRYGHAGYGWLGALVAFGDAAKVPVSLLLLGLAGIGSAAWAVSRIADHLGRSAWWGSIVAVNPGLVLSVTLLTSEPVGVGLAALGLLLWLRQRVVPAGVLLAGACLVKEPFVLVPAALLAWEAIQALRHRAHPGVAGRSFILCASVVPLALWYLYLRIRFGVFPFQRAPDVFGMPLAGWFDSFRRGVGLVRSGASQVGTVTITLLVIVASAMLVGTARALRLRSPFDVIFLIFAALATVFNWLLLVFPKDLVRELIVPLLLLPAVVGRAWPIEASTAAVQGENDGDS
jgi:hypothetical protein